ncbi:Rpn family recombination-promoting nuclease/putative transposase [Massilia sp. erpn]|uniref:Rpn family recombination-promoting nuclease/putative transposase n=1 Tax=Massilia sp. erpn TaxID=2738142 RepID=UPI0021066EDC|nr:Rpn family recombination-promoting nuclease/putative transposase [Massilia sp. erpn]
MANQHDSAYRQLFSHPEMVADLLRGFLPPDWLSQLELGTLERVSGSYVGEEGAQRHSDMVWKLRVAGNGSTSTSCLNSSPRLIPGWPCACRCISA